MGKRNMPLGPCKFCGRPARELTDNEEWGTEYQVCLGCARQVGDTGIPHIDADLLDEERVQGITIGLGFNIPATRLGFVARSEKDLR